MSNETFFAPLTEDIEIERHGETYTFRVRELLKSESQEVFDIANAKGKRDPAKAKKIDSRIIAKSVSIVEKSDAGEVLKPITFAQANEMGTGLARQLVSVALRINGIGDEADDEKN